jgi:DNA-directed RNA polymerase specialized sigma24 family protein
LRLAFEAERAKAEGWLRRGLDAIYAHCWDGTTYAALAAAWNVPEGTLRNWVMDALQHLRKVLGDA